MIQDKDTNIVYLSKTLSQWKVSKDFSVELIKLLEELNIRYEWIPQTKDIWARDYMPIQIEENCFLKYNYSPDYLRKTKKDQSYITDCTDACKQFGIVCDNNNNNNLIIDGGNVVLCGDKVVMTEKVYTENKPEKEDKDWKESIHNELEKAFKHKIVIIPWRSKGEIGEKGVDYFGHSDGFIKYCGDNRILMSNHRDDDEDEAIEIRKKLEKNGFEVTEMLFTVDYPQKDLNWAYINFLQVGNNIIMPKFEIAEDEQAKRYVQTAFPYCRVRQIDCREIAKEGGALHCISWNIKK